MQHLARPRPHARYLCRSRHGIWYVRWLSQPTREALSAHGRCADPASRPGDQRLASGQWPGPVGDMRGARGQANHLPGDEGTFRREEKPQRAFQLLFGALTDIDQLQRTAAAQLLGQRA